MAVAFLHVDRLGELLEAQPALGLRFASACFAAAYASLRCELRLGIAQGVLEYGLAKPPVG